VYTSILNIVGENLVMCETALIADSTLALHSQDGQPDWFIQAIQSDK